MDGGPSGPRCGRRRGARKRAELVIELLDSLEPPLSGEQRTDDAWIAEVERRARAALAGSPGISWDEARARIRLPSR